MKRRKFTADHSEASLGERVTPLHLGTVAGHKVVWLVLRAYATNTASVLTAVSSGDRARFETTRSRETELRRRYEDLQSANLAPKKRTHVHETFSNDVLTRLRAIELCH